MNGSLEVKVIPLFSPARFCAHFPLSLEDKVTCREHIIDDDEPTHSPVRTQVV